MRQLWLRKPQQRNISTSKSKQLLIKQILPAELAGVFLAEGFARQWKPRWEGAAHAAVAGQRGPPCPGEMIWELLPLGKSALYVKYEYTQDYIGICIFILNRNV